MSFLFIFYQPDEIKWQHLVSIWKGTSNTILGKRGRELSIFDGQNSWQPQILNNKALERSFYNSSHFIDEELEIQKRWWLATGFISDMVGTRTQLSFHPCANSIKGCYEPNTGLAMQQKTSLLQTPPHWLSTTVFWSPNPPHLPPFSQPHGLPVFRVVLLHPVVDYRQLGGKGEISTLIYSQPLMY